MWNGAGLVKLVGDIFLTIYSRIIVKVPIST